MKSKILYMVFAIYAVMFFAANAVRCWVNGQWFVGGLFMFGAFIGVGMGCYIKDEADHEKRKKHEDIKHYGTKA